MQPAVFVAFGVAFGNIEREPSERVPMYDLCQAWNKALRDNQIQIQLVHWYRHTGNFVLYGIGMDVKRVSDSLESISKRMLPNLHRLPFPGDDGLLEGLWTPTQVAQPLPTQQQQSLSALVLSRSLD